MRLDPVRDRELIEKLLSKNGPTTVMQGKRVADPARIKQILRAQDPPGQRVEEIRLVLDLPPTVNHMYRTGRDDGKRHLSEDARAFKKHVQLATRIQKTGWIDGLVEASVKIFTRRDNSDLDDRLKALFDSMNGLCYKDDRQIKRFREFEIAVDATNPRAEVYLKKIG